MPILKVDNEEIKLLYKRHVAILVSYLCNLHPVVMFHPLQRAFARDEKENAAHNTYKAFQQWLVSMFQNGIPSREDLEHVYQDENLLHCMPPPVQLHQSSGEDLQSSP